AAGNAVILKPSEITSSAALELGRIALAAGLPAGLLQVLPGAGASVGSALVAHPGVKMVTFTGGTASGRRIAEMAARKLMPAALELGGKSPHIVFADASIDEAVNAVIGGIFEGSGQSCVAGSRLFVQRSVKDSVLDKVLAAVRALQVDLPDAAGAQMGPIASFQHRDRIASMVDNARADGAQVLCGGARPPQTHLATGAFYLPTVVTGITNGSGIAQQEVFGPVLCVLPFDDEEDLIAQANDSVYGLAAGVWTSDFARAWRVARLLEAGTVWINTYKQLSLATPFGGFKDSGLGREKGIGGLRLYQQSKSLYLGLSS
ncbi:MAG: aldehyde dehydrogenase family protein, partial [Betaproteobacteria bacterium]|nr:aldehyde dehydrogenase family protein [Betaproteobacteria bacterium]